MTAPDRHAPLGVMSFNSSAFRETLWAAGRRTEREDLVGGALMSGWETWRTEIDDNPDRLADCPASIAARIVQVANDAAVAAGAADGRVVVRVAALREQQQRQHAGDYCDLLRHGGVVRVLSAVKDCGGTLTEELAAMLLEERSGDLHGSHVNALLSSLARDNRVEVGAASALRPHLSDFVTVVFADEGLIDVRYAVEALNVQRSEFAGRDIFGEVTSARLLEAVVGMLDVCAATFQQQWLDLDLSVEAQQAVIDYASVKLLVQAVQDGRLVVTSERSLTQIASRISGDDAAGLSMRPGTPPSEGIVRLFGGHVANMHPIGGDDSGVNAHIAAMWLVENAGGPDELRLALELASAMPVAAALTVARLAVGADAAA